MKIVRPVASCCRGLPKTNHMFFYKFNEYADTIKLKENETILGCEVRPIKYVTYDGQLIYNEGPTECVTVTSDELQRGVTPDLWSLYILTRDTFHTDAQTDAQLIAECETKEGAEALQDMLNVLMNFITQR